MEEIINATGMTFKEATSAMQNLVNTRLIDVIPQNHGIPKFNLLDEAGAQKFLELAQNSDKLIF